jgi:hypothetical protein
MENRPEQGTRGQESCDTISEVLWVGGPAAHACMRLNMRAVCVTFADHCWGGADLLCTWMAVFAWLGPLGCEVDATLSEGGTGPASGVSGTEY